MCDSAISESCLADFTNYCPVNSLCDEDIGPQKKHRQRSKVRSRVALFSRRAKGQSRPTIGSQHRVKALGEDAVLSTASVGLCSDDPTLSDQELDIGEWSSDESTCEEDTVLQDSSWLHEQSSGYVSRVELNALKGCVMKRRALFSPNSAAALVYQCSLPDGPPDEALPEPSEKHRHDSVEYDHLVDFKQLGAQLSASQDSCSVSVMFGSAGYDCKAIHRPGTPTSSHKSTAQQGLEVTACYCIRHSSTSALSDLARLECKPLPSSQSIPSCLHTRDQVQQPKREFVCPILPLQPQKPVDSSGNAPSQVSNHTKPTNDSSNSWPRNRAYSVAHNNSKMFEVSSLRKVHRPNMHSHSRSHSLVRPSHQQYSHHRSPFPSPQHSPLTARRKCSTASTDVARTDMGLESSSFSLYGRTNELGSTVSVRSSASHQSVSTLASSSWCDNRSHSTFVNGVEGRLFKERTDMLMSWFSEFNDQQRNTLLMRLLEQCNCAQMHFLSIQMEPILHDGCPHNCQDLLSWLPPNISWNILSYLDPVSLCQASQVSRSWNYLASYPQLWKSLCRQSNWQLSLMGEMKHLELFTLPDSSVQWKQMFAERFRIRRNWLKGYCNVRTFEGHTQGISCIQFDDTRIVSGSWDKTIKVWNRRTNTAWAALTLAGHSGMVRCLHLHGNRLVSGSSDRTIKVWDLATDKVGWVGAACRATMVGHMHTVRCLQADSKKVISGSYDLTLKVWDIKTGRCENTLRGHTDAVLCLHFNEEKLVSGSKDTTIKVWSLPAGECELTLYGHQAAVTCLQFDSTRVISGALDRLIKIWNLTTGKCVLTMDWICSEGHTGVVRHLQADSWKIISAADDKTLKVWSVHTGERLLTLKSHTDGVTCLQFNDEVIVSGSYDKTVKLWDFSAC